MKKITILILFLAISASSYSQNQKQIDSLTYLILNMQVEQQEVKMHLDRAANYQFMSIGSFVLSAGFGIAAGSVEDENTTNTLQIGSYIFAGAGLLAYLVSWTEIKKAGSTPKQKKSKALPASYYDEIYQEELRKEREADDMYR